jgi:bacteriorhodopsin
MDEATLHWLYVAVMAAGALLFFIWSQNPRGVPKHEYLIAMFIPIWSGAAYMGMALGQGKIEVDGQITYYARYLDWVVTTPLLLLALSLTAMYKTSKDWTTIAGIMGADAFMIICGLIADLSETPARFVWYGLGTAAFLVIMWIIWVTLRRKAAENPDPRIAGAFNRAAAYLTIFWIGYPLTWLIGPSGLGLVPQSVDTLLFVVLPIFSKVGFSILDLLQLRSLSSTDEGLPNRQAVRSSVAGAD